MSIKGEINRIVLKNFIRIFTEKANSTNVAAIDV